MVKNAQLEQIMIPIISNSRPYHELIIRGYLRLGECDVYTRSWWLSDLTTPLPLLLYNSSKVVGAVARKYQDEFDSWRLPRGVIVAYTEVIDWRRLTDEESILILQKFNKFTRAEALQVIKESIPGEETNYIWPLEYGIFFRKVIRLKNPIPFRPDGQKSFYTLPLLEVVSELKKSGLKISEVVKLLKSYQ